MGLFLPALIFVEKIIAFFKQVIVAGFFGTNEFTDAYQMAENIVSILRGAFSNSIPIVFLAMLVQKKTKNKEWLRFSAEVIGTGIIFVLIITILLSTIIAALDWVQTRADTQIDAYASSLYKFILVLAPTVFLGFLSSIMSTQLEAEKVYWPAKITSLFTSVCVIVFVVLLFKKLNIVSIFIGEIAALIIHIVVLFALLRRSRVLVRPKIKFRSDDMMLLWKKSIPLLVSSSVYSLNSLVDKTIAIEIAAGSATVLQYARVLTLDLFPAIIVTAFSGVLVRDFSELVASGKKKDLGSLFEVYLEALIGFLGVVAIVSLFNSEDLISMAFHRGAFDGESVNMTNTAFIGYVFGVFLFPIREVSARVHYAFNDTKTPFVSSMVGVAVNVALSILLSKTIGLLGIAIATSVSIFVSGIINVVILRKKTNIKTENLLVESTKSLVGFAGVFMINYLFTRFDVIGNKFANLLVVSLLSLVIYYLVIGLLKAKSTVYFFTKARR